MSVHRVEQQPVTDFQQMTNPHPSEGFLMPHCLGNDVRRFDVEVRTGQQRFAGSTAIEQTLYLPKHGRTVGADSAIIFEPGAGTVPDEYAPFLRRLASRGFVVATTVPVEGGGQRGALDRRVDVCAEHFERLRIEVSRVTMLGYSLGNQVTTEAGASLLDKDTSGSAPAGLHAVVGLGGFGHEVVGFARWPGRIAQFGRELGPATVFQFPSLFTVAKQSAPHVKRLTIEALELLATNDRAHRNHQRLEASGVKSRKITMRRDALVRSGLIEKPDAIVPVNTHLAPLTHPRVTEYVVGGVMDELHSSAPTQTLRQLA